MFKIMVINKKTGELSFWSKEFQTANEAFELLGIQNALDLQNFTFHVLEYIGRFEKATWRVVNEGWPVNKICDLS